jgi:aryl sulfotransferase
MQKATVRYRSIVHDSARFDGFEFHDGDIIISTPPKCGTTWTQTICALLIFQTPDFPAHVDQLSPWLEQSLRPLDEVKRDLAAQTHRRFIKSHTPLDGLPFDERVTYICVGRDPRDVALSWDNHMSNLDFQSFFALREKAVGTDDLEELMPPPEALMRPESEADRFWGWVDAAAPIADDFGSLAFTLHHLGSFHAKRDLQNVVMLHYGDLQDDLEGQMRALATRLGIDVPEERWPELVPAATFEQMKSKAVDVAPNATENIWLDQGRFFNKGTSGQWRHLLDDEGMRRYAARVRELADPELAQWAHRGPVLP